MHPPVKTDHGGYADAALVFLACVITRLPFTSGFLYNMDSVQFALAMDLFDVAVHQPQPPGYFLYVMLGRLAGLVTQDHNTALVAVSIFFSGLCATMVYLTARMVYGRAAGITAAVLAVTSPLFWFHGEVALSYMPEAFMSALVAYLCYRMLKGEHGLYPAAAVALALAGGIRQNTMVFLMPLWLYSMKGLGVRKALGGLAVFGLTTLAWFVPMLSSTGGYERYSAALDAHWNDANWRGIHLHWIAFNARYMAYFMLVGLVLAAVPLVELGYGAVRGGAKGGADRETVWFFMLWILPPLLFHLIIFTHPAVPGHSLIYMVALIILAARGADYVSGRLAGASASLSVSGVRAGLVVLIAAVNTLFFLFAPYPLSVTSVRAHDAMLSRYIEAIKSGFSPDDTLIIGSGRFIFSYRHAMYYLPEFKVYDTVLLTTPDGPRTLWGRHRTTHKAADITIGPEIDRVVDFMNYRPEYTHSFPPEARVQRIGDGDLLVYYEDLEGLRKVDRIAPLLPGGDGDKQQAP